MEGEANVPPSLVHTEALPVRRIMVGVGAHVAVLASSSQWRAAPVGSRSWFVCPARTGLEMTDNCPQCKYLSLDMKKSPLRTDWKCCKCNFFLTIVRKRVGKRLVIVDIIGLKSRQLVV